ncbi:MAG: hypothetical protein HUK02_07160 [Bacteroidaceae bacterium]|nr:hypothetical protein [Bacteroidaceae bacterium]
MRNCNPLNLRRTGKLWQGLRACQTDRTYYQFENMAWGYRAAFVVARIFVTCRGCDTLEKLVARWTSGLGAYEASLYLRRVCVLTRFEKDDKICPFNAQQMIPLVMAMSRVENGKPANSVEVARGWVLYMG